MKHKMAIMLNNETGKTGIKHTKSFVMPTDIQGKRDLQELTLNVLLTALVSVIRSAAEQGLINKFKTLDMIEDHLKSVDILNPSEIIIPDLQVAGGTFVTK